MMMMIIIIIIILALKKIQAGTQVVASSFSLAELYLAIKNTFIRCDIFMPDKGKHSQHLL